VYNKVHISLSTHDAGGLTDKDFLLAKEIDATINSSQI
jgi:4a-hydroxytetrahydrobiopterin dehydratase